jgi:hypothetical protein
MRMTIFFNRRTMTLRRKRRRPFERSRRNLKGLKEADSVGAAAATV